MERQTFLDLRLLLLRQKSKKVDAVIESHHEFMEETHSLDGDMQTCLNSHPVIKLAQMVDFTDPSKVTTGNIINIISEC